jgi:hypothetical protein
MRIPALFLAAFFLYLPAHAGSQVVRGQLLNGDTGLPLEGAMVVLQGDSGEIGRVLSNAAGRFLFRVPGTGKFTLRADRIGHQSTTSDPFQVASGDTVDIQMVSEVQAIQLEGLEVSGERRCEVRPGAGRAVATVWEEARKALAAAALTDASNLYRYRTIRFTRDLDERGRRVRSEQRRASQQFQQTPFESLPAEELVNQGFVRTDPDGDLYYAPDAEVLLSDAFLDTHCLRLEPGRGDNDGLIGVGFEPIGGRNQTDIRGVVWLTPMTGELRHLDYTYENIDPALRSDAVGGKVVFQGLPNGSWIVNQWRIRMPIPALAPDFRGSRQVVLAGIHEVGGQVDQVQDRSGNLVLQAERASLTGTVLDETGTRPMVGAVVEVIGTSATARTDSLGSFTLSGLSEGFYGVRFSHPSVPTLAGFPEPVDVDLVAGAMSSVTLQAPSVEEVLEAACEDVVRPRGSAVLLGQVLDGETGEAMPGATVRVMWSDFRFAGGSQGASLDALLGVQEDGLEGPADADGRFMACAVPTDQALTLEAEAEGIPSARIAHRIPLGATHSEMDVTITRAGTGSLVGLAVGWEDQGPLESVEITLQGTDFRGTSDDDGRFSFDDVPLGRYVLKAELLGRRTVTDTVQIRPDRPLQMEVRLPPEALEVEGITVEVLSQAQLDVRTEGRAGATLDRLTPEEMDDLRDNVSNVVDVIQSMGSPRIRITEYGPQGFPLGFCMRWQRAGHPPSPHPRHRRSWRACPRVCRVGVSPCSSFWTDGLSRRARCSRHPATSWRWTRKTSSRSKFSPQCRLSSGSANSGRQTMKSGSHGSRSL